MGSLEAVVLLVVAAFVLAPIDVETKAILKVNIVIYFKWFIWKGKYVNRDFFPPENLAYDANSSM